MHGGASSATEAVSKRSLAVMPAAGAPVEGTIPSALWEHWGSEGLLASDRALEFWEESKGSSPAAYARLPQRIRTEVKKANKGTLQPMKRLSVARQNGKFVSVEHPSASFFWALREVKQAACAPGVYIQSIEKVFTRAGRPIQIWVMHNSEALRALMEARGNTQVQGYEHWVVLLACGVGAEMLAHEGGLPPREHSQWGMWASEQLRDATASLHNPSAVRGAANGVAAILATMVPGREMEHLVNLLRWADYRGSDVRLDAGELFDGSRQVCPYPATAWKWRSVLAWPWRRRQHINVLEFTAFLTYLHSKVAHSSFQGQRIFHVFDSRVAACVVTKGRSCSRVLNRGCRRLFGVRCGLQYIRAHIVDSQSVELFRCSQSVASTPMVMNKRQKARVRSGHVKYAGISQTILAKVPEKIAQLFSFSACAWVKLAKELAGIRRYLGGVHKSHVSGRRKPRLRTGDFISHETFLSPLQEGFGDGISLCKMLE